MPSHCPRTGLSLHKPLADPAQRIGKIAGLLRELASAGPRHDSAAHQRLQEYAPTAGELTVLSRDHNPYIRSGAIWWIRHLQENLPASLVDALQLAVRDSNPHVVQAALGSAGVLRLAELRAEALRCLRDGNPAVVHSAIFALGRIGPVEMGEKLLPFLRAREQHLQKAALTALIQLRYQPAVDELLRRLEAICKPGRQNARAFDLARLYLQALVILEAQQAVPLLIRLASETVGLRGLAVQALTELRAEQAAPALLPLLERLRHSHHEEKLCCRLLRFLLVVDYRFALPTVRAFLEHRLPGVRIAALQVLAEWRDRSSLAAIRSLAYEDPSAFVRPAAVKALVELAAGEALPDLQQLAADANTLVRAAVAQAASQLQEREKAAETLVLSLAADSSQMVARAARPVERLSSHSAELLPSGLREQLPAARAFLRCWQATPDVPPELHQALTVVLKALRAA